MNGASRSLLWDTRLLLADTALRKKIVNATSIVSSSLSLRVVVWLIKLRGCSRRKELRIYGPSEIQWLFYTVDIRSFDLLDG